MARKKVLNPFNYLLDQVVERVMGVLVGHLLD